MHIAVLGSDLAKSSCSVAGLEATGRVVLRRRLRRDGVVKLAAEMPTCIVAMEAYCGAHHSRVLMPRAYIDTILSSKPGKRRWYLAMSCG
jgi:hypothetical protein